jgi:glycosyltransferase involved in cell wall biosynthesis
LCLPSVASAQIEIKDSYGQYEPIEFTLRPQENAQAVWEVRPLSGQTEYTTRQYGQTQAMWAQPGKYLIVATVVVVDFDDHWEPDMRHPMFIQARTSGIVKAKISLIQEASYLSVTTPVYKDTIHKKFGLKNIHVFPNAIDENEGQFKPKPIPSDKIRFGWLGGSSHLADIELLKNGITSVYKTHKDKVQFVLCGFDLRGTITEYNKQTGEKRVRPIKPEETVWYKYEQIFSNDYKSVDDNYKSHLMNFTDSPQIDTSEKKYVRVWTQPIGRYGANYNLFDVSLAPIVPSEFNSNKSQLKIIEAGFHKKPIIASENMPYTIDLKSSYKEGKFLDSGNSLLVPQNKNHKQWYKYMKLLIENPNMIEDLGNRLYETVKDKYSLVTVSKDRTEFFKTII